MHLSLASDHLLLDDQRFDWRASAIGERLIGAAQTLSAACESDHSHHAEACASLTPDALSALGRGLFKALFSPGSARLDAYRAAPMDDPLLLSVEGDLADLPWELLRDGKGGDSPDSSVPPDDLDLGPRLKSTLEDTGVPGIDLRRCETSSAKADDQRAGALQVRFQSARYKCDCRRLKSTLEDTGVPGIDLSGRAKPTAWGRRSLRRCENLVREGGRPARRRSSGAISIARIPGGSAINAEPCARAHSAGRRWPAPPR